MPPDPFLRALAAAAEDEEPETEEERAAIAEARVAIARGEVEPWEHVRDPSERPTGHASHPQTVHATQRLYLRDPGR